MVKLKKGEWCMKKVNRVLHTIMNTVVAFFICRSVFYIWDYIAHPEVYAVQSAPWYTAMLLLGIYTLFVGVVCSVIKALIKWRMKKSEGKEVLKSVRN